MSFNGWFSVYYNGMKLKSIYQKVGNQQISENEIRFIIVKVITVYYCKGDYTFTVFFTQLFWQQKLPPLFRKKIQDFFLQCMSCHQNQHI